MEFKKDFFERAFKNGSVEVTKKFSQLIGADVKASVVKVEIVPLQAVLERIELLTNYPSIASVQAFDGTPGLSFLLLSREDALALVDLLNEQDVGTTAILKDIDRSAIKETLNILANTYVAALAKSAKIDIKLEVPTMITAGRLKNIITDYLGESSQKKDHVIFGETTLMITDYKLRMMLYLIFDGGLAELIKE